VVSSAAWPVSPNEQTQQQQTDKNDGITRHAWEREQ
jgi:hypothetical protein